MKPSLRIWVLVAAIVLGGCATKSTIDTRRVERNAAYSQLSPEERELVDQGQIKIGMSADAVYIAWGAPSEILESEDSQSGRITTWRYFGSWMEETRYWSYRETFRGGSEPYLERYLMSDYNPRDYVRAELHIKDGKVVAWRTLPRPQ